MSTKVDLKTRCRPFVVPPLVHYCSIGERNGASHRRRIARVRIDTPAANAAPLTNNELQTSTEQYWPKASSSSSFETGASLPVLVGRSKKARRRGISLIEVIVSTAILVATSIAIGQLISIGRLHSIKAEQATTAQVLGQNQMAELLSGTAPMETVEREPFINKPGWSYSVQIAPVGLRKLIAIEVQIFRDPTTRASTSPDVPLAPQQNNNGNALDGAPSFELVRWIRHEESFDSGTSSQFGLQQ